MLPIVADHGNRGLSGRRRCVAIAQHSISPDGAANAFELVRCPHFSTMAYVRDIEESKEIRR
jgi:hypothetical protein